jgi:hypothetical protein
MKNFQLYELRLDWSKFCRAVNTNNRINQKKISRFLYSQLKLKELIPINRN